MRTTVSCLFYAKAALTSPSGKWLASCSFRLNRASTLSCHCIPLLGALLGGGASVAGLLGLGGGGAADGGCTEGGGGGYDTIGGPDGGLRRRTYVRDTLRIGGGEGE